MSDRLVMVEQRHSESNGDGAPWILDRHGQKMRGHDDGRGRLAADPGLRLPKQASIAIRPLFAVLLLLFALFGAGRWRDRWWEPARGQISRNYGSSPGDPLPK